MQKKPLTKEQALQKLRHYCRYQERCHYEVEQKLWELQVKRGYHDEIISALIEGNDLNEERFAMHFAAGKFNLLHWGRKKIHYALKEKRVSSYSIKKALDAIKPADYFKTLMDLAEKKYESLKTEQHLVRKKKIQDYLLQKGYEMQDITQVISELANKTAKK